MQAFGAVSELIVAVMSPLLVVLQGHRAAVLGFFFFQYVVRRYRVNALTVQAVGLLTSRVDGALNHKWCPRALGLAFGKLKAAVKWAAGKIN